MYFIFVSASGTGGNAAPAGAVARATIFSCDHCVLERAMSDDQPILSIQIFSLHVLQTFKA